MYFPTRSATSEFLGDYISENPQWGAALELLQYGKFEPQLISYQGVRDAAEMAFNEIMQGADIQATLDALVALDPNRIYLVGGTGTITNNVRNQLVPYASSGLVTRLSGPNRYATAAAVADLAEWARLALDGRIRPAVPAVTGLVVLG